MSDIYNATTRFSNRVDDYLRYRPRYPQEVISFLRESGYLSQSDVIADIGSGTGFLSLMFLEIGNKVFAVEPNKEMRLAGEQFLMGHGDVASIDGTAEATTLPELSVDIVTAAQAFHWFDIEKFRDECRRILRGKALAIMMWNIRDQESTPFLRAYEQLLRVHGTDYAQIRHHDISDDEVGVFYGGAGCRIQSFPNNQVLDFESVKGRLLSASYVPKTGEKGFDPMIADLRKIFDQHQQDGAVEIRYTTKLFIGKVPSHVPQQSA